MAASVTTATAHIMGHTGIIGGTTYPLRLLPHLSPSGGALRLLHHLLSGQPHLLPRPPLGQAHDLPHRHLGNRRWTFMNSSFCGGSGRGAGPCSSDVAA